MIEVGPLQAGDRSAWEGLARGYKAFYRDWIPDEAYEATWRRLRPGTEPRGAELYGLGARLDGRLIGIAHYFFHPAFWSGDACYLQDLFVDEDVRGHGAARALIEGVAAAAREHGATRYYWHTQEDNARARALYDKVAQFTGFIRYQYPLLRTRRATSVPLGHGPDPGDEHLHAQPVVEIGVAVGHLRGALDQARVPGGGQHGQVDLVAPVKLGALLLGQLRVVASLAHDQRDPGPQRAPGDLGGVLSIEPGAEQDLQGALGGAQRRLVPLLVLEHQRGRRRMGA
jgi:GNAT superfamily N-acetyltransferase